MPVPDAAPLSVSVIGAAGTCGRQFAIGLLHGHHEVPTRRLQLVGHRGGATEDELHGIRADLRDAYSDGPVEIDIADTPEAVDGDVVVMLAGRTLPTDPREDVDRALLARHNHGVFCQYAEVLARRPGPPPYVIVQSNPVEAGVAVFARALGPDRVIGAGAHSDSQRFRRELAIEFGVSRPEVAALTAGQHGDHLVPLWSSVRIAGVDEGEVRDRIAARRAGRPLAGLPDEIAALRTRLLLLLADGDVDGAFAAVADEPPDLRSAVKPFLVHYSSGATTEVMTAHAVFEVLRALTGGPPLVTSAQVRLDGGWAGLTGVGGVPVTISADGWRIRREVEPAPDELEAVAAAFAAVDTLLRSLD